MNEFIVYRAENDSFLAVIHTKRFDVNTDTVTSGAEGVEGYWPGEWVISECPTCRVTHGRWYLSKESVRAAEDLCKTFMKHAEARRKEEENHDK